MSDLPEETPFEIAPELEPSEFIEPPPKATPFYDRQIEARTAGYTWPEINDHIADRTTAALAAGYTEGEVRGYLGLPDPGALQDRLQAQWGTRLSLEEDVNQFIEPLPATIEPLEAMTAARTAAHAGQAAPEARMPLDDKPPMASPLDLHDQEARQSYMDALLKGETTGPQDFAERYTGALWGALSDRGVELDDGAATSLIRSGRILSATLPSNEELTDTAIALAHSSNLPLDLGFVGDAKENLLDYWVETGTPPMDAYREAAFDPLLQDALTAPPPQGISTFAPPPPPETEEQKKLRAELAPSLEELQRPGRDRINPVSIFGEPVEHKSILGDLEDLGVTVVVGGVGGHYLFKAGGLAIGALRKSAAGQWVAEGIGNLLLGPAVRAEAPAAERRIVSEAEAEALARTVTPPEIRRQVATDASAEPVARGLPEVPEVAAAKAAQMERLRLENTGAEPTGMESGRFFQRVAAGESSAVAEGKPSFAEAEAFLAKGRDAMQQKADALGQEAENLPLGNPRYKAAYEEQQELLGKIESVHTTLTQLEDDQIIDVAFGMGLRQTTPMRRLLADESGAVEIHVGKVAEALYADITRLGKARAERSPELPVPPSIAEMKPLVTALEDDIYRLRTNAVADKVVLSQMIEKMPEHWLTPELQKKISQEVEGRLLPGGKAVPFSPEVQEVLTGVKALTDRQEELGNAIRAKLAGLEVDDPLVAAVKSVDEGYVHRIVQGKERGSLAHLDPGTDMDVITGGALQGGQRSISKFAPGMQARSMYVLENEAGARIWGNRPLSEIRSGDAKVGFGDTLDTAHGKWTVKQATMEEVEANTDIRYHKNFLAATVDNVATLERVNRNLDFLATQAASLEEKGLFVKGLPMLQSTPDKAAGMIPVELPGMRGWADPRIANVLNDFWAGGKGDLDGLVTRINRFVTGSLFVSPVVHAGNVGAHWGVGRGWDWVKPSGYGSLAKDGAAALREVWFQGPRYIKHLREGSGLLYASTTTENFHKMIMTKLFHEQLTDPTWIPFAKGFGWQSVKDMVAAEYKWSRKTLWAANDVFNLQRQFELERKGLSMREAIFQAEKDIPNYRVPSEVMGSHAMSEFLKSPNYMVFGRYRYGQVRALAGMVDDMARGSNAERGEALGKAVVLGAMALGAWPLINTGLRAATGDEGWSIKNFGPLSLIDAGVALAQMPFTGVEKAYASATSSFMGLAPLINIAKQVLTNTDVWGRKLVDSKATAIGQAVQGLEAVGNTFYPSQVLLTAIKDGNINRAVSGLIGGSYKKPVDAVKQSKWDKIEQSRAWARERKDNLEQGIKSLLNIRDVTTSTPAPRGRPSGGGGERKPSSDNWGSQ